MEQGGWFERGGQHSKQRTLDSEREAMNGGCSDLFGLVEGKVRRMAGREGAGREARARGMEKGGRPKARASEGK